MKQTEKIENVLDDICVPSNLIGYQYWIYAIELSLNYKHIGYKIYMDKLYRDISIKYHNSWCGVERALRYAREKSIIKTKGNQKFLAEVLKIYNRRYN